MYSGMTRTSIICLSLTLSPVHISYKPAKMSHAQEGNRQQAKARTTEANSSKEKGKEKQPEVMDTMFVGWVPGSQNEPRKTAPRLHHKKSRTGCQQCRARRVKVRWVCLVWSRFRSSIFPATQMSMYFLLASVAQASGTPQTLLQAHEKSIYLRHLPPVAFDTKRLSRPSTPPRETSG